MNVAHSTTTAWGRVVVVNLLAVVLLLTLAACSQTTPTPQPSAAAAPTGGTVASAPTATAVPLKLLTVSPEKGPVGTDFTITGQGFTPGQQVDFQWVTVEGAYVTQVSPANVEFHERQFRPKRLPLGRAVADAQGHVTAKLTAPEDFGESHEIYAQVDGQDVAKGGFRILRTAHMAPAEGAVGTLITITIKGLDWKPYQRSMTVLYDNKYTGVATAVTTRGTATFQVRAAGPVGPRSIQLIQGAVAPYLNVQESQNAPLYAHLPTKNDFRWVFNVTHDNGPPPDAIAWPDPERVQRLGDASPRTAASGVAAAPGIVAELAPSSGPARSPATLRASGLPSGLEAELIWVSARGSRVSPSGWELIETSLVKATVAADGSLTAPMVVPDDLGGWHAVKLMAGNKVLAEVPYYVERNLVEVSPKRVKAGEPFTIHINGVGWTELDNTVAVVYDNAYVGYACGFASGGQVTVTLIATGEPGTHLIDLYPVIFREREKTPPSSWNLLTPFLTYADDFPGLALGYRVPAFRLAIEVVE